MESLQPLFVTLGSAVVFLLIGWLITNWGLFLIEAKKNEQFKQAVGLVNQGVQMVEQQFGSLDGPEKKAEATKFILEQAKFLGLTVNPLLVAGLIEAAVYGLHSLDDVKG